MEFILDGMIPAAPTTPSCRRGWTHILATMRAKQDTRCGRSTSIQRHGAARFARRDAHDAARTRLDGCAATSEVARVFGAEFAEAIKTLPVGGWQGPVRSGFGLHLVELRSGTMGAKRLSRKSDMRWSAIWCTPARRKQPARSTRDCAPITSCA